MKKNTGLSLIFLALAILALTLSACGPKATPEPVTFTVSGMVKSELQLGDGALHKLAVVTLNLTHPKSGAADYTGVRLNDLLNKAGLQSGAAKVTLTGSDGYTFDVDLATFQACTDCLLAFDAAKPGVYSSAMPGQSGKAWVKGLVSITVK
jgi:hypothetical protein